jgi:hypothetical protein
MGILDNRRTWWHRRMVALLIVGERLSGCCFLECNLVTERTHIEADKDFFA